MTDSFSSTVVGPPRTRRGALVAATLSFLFFGGLGVLLVLAGRTVAGVVMIVAAVLLVALWIVLLPHRYDENGRFRGLPDRREEWKRPR